MWDILEPIENWRTKKVPLALATVVETWGSSPRRVGAKMAVTGDGEIAGSVSGGCVEGAVVERGLSILSSGKPELLHFGVADETAWGVGLACGGTIDVLVERLSDRHFTFARAAVEAEEPTCTVTIVGGPEPFVGAKASLAVGEEERVLEPEDQRLAEPMLALAREALQQGRPMRRQIAVPGVEGALDLFADVSLAPPTLVMVGGVHVAVALASLAATLGYRTVVIDPRRSFGSEARFPQVDRLMQMWPEQALESVRLGPSTAVAVLTHDPKIDDRALKVALPSRAGYVGALGSRKTQAKRRQRLLEAGLTEAQLDRLHGPIGLSIGAQTPEEIALSIMAEVVAVQRGAAAG